MEKESLIDKTINIISKAVFRVLYWCHLFPRVTTPSVDSGNAGSSAGDPEADVDDLIVGDANENENDAGTTDEIRSITSKITSLGELAWQLNEKSLVMLYVMNQFFHEDQKSCCAIICDNAEACQEKKILNALPPSLHVSMCFSTRNFQV